MCLCGERVSVELADQDRFGLPIGVVACETCGLARTSPRLAEADLPNFYRDDYHGLHMGVSKPDPSMSLFRPGQGAMIYARVRNLLPMDRSQVAEIGCGTGQVLREFQREANRDGRTVEIVGCEYAPNFVQAGRSVGTDVRQGGTEELEGEGPFDLVILSHVLEHFGDVPGEMGRIARLVRPDAHIYVEVPGILSIHRKPEYEFDFLRYLTLAHTYHFSLDTLTDAMDRSGFELVEGDEQIRSIFRHRQGDARREVSRSARTLVAYLNRLHTSPSVRLRRYARRTVQRSAGVRHAIRAIVGSRIYHWIRSGIQRLGLIR